MADIVSRRRRSEMMAGIKGRDTKPERLVRSALHRAGFRFRLMSGNGLPGRPDIVLPKYRTAIFVHGCFWHRHPRCRFAYTPKSNRAFWSRKFRENVERDRRKLLELRSLGWRILAIWECQTGERDLQKVIERLRRIRRS